VKLFDTYEYLPPSRLPFNICFIYLANLIDLILGLLKPLYACFYHLMADIFIGGN
jgi:hypothetical protein